MTLLVVTLTFLAMEPTTYAMHRWVMHGRAMAWHRGHHRPSAERFELNDRFPVLFAALGLATFAAGASIGSLALLVPVSMGAAAYGIAYFFVHDVYIHRRFGLYRGVARPLGRLAEAHRIHHLFGGEPYGMLAPVVPRSLRRRAEALDQRRQGRSSASGAMPSQVPTGS